MAIKVTLLFQDATGVGAGGVGTLTHVGGWSESYYMSGQTIDEVKLRLYGPGVWGQGLCPARALLLPASAAIMGQRFQQVLPKTGSSQTAGQIFTGDPTNVTDVPQMAILVAAPGSGVVNVRRWYLRGVPDTKVTFGEFTPDIGYAFAVQQFFNELFQWGFVGQDFTIPTIDIVSINNVGLVTLAAAHNYFVGDTIAIKKTLRDLPEEFLSFKRTVASVGPLANQFTLNNWVGNVSTGGTSRKVVYLVMQFNSANIAVNRVGVRKVGRPFGGYRGRRSKRKVL